MKESSIWKAVANIMLKQLYETSQEKVHRSKSLKFYSPVSYAISLTVLIHMPSNSSLQIMLAIVNTNCKGSDKQHKFSRRVYVKRTSHLIILFILSFFINNYFFFFLFDFFLVVTSANPEYTVACLKSQVNDTNLLLLLLLLLSPLPLPSHTPPLLLFYSEIKSEQQHGVHSIDQLDTP